MTKQFKQGDTVYSDYGQQAKYVAKIGEGHIVRPLVEAYSGDGETSYEHICEPITWAHVFEKPPTAKYTAALTELNKKLESARAELFAVQTLVTEHNRDHSDLLKRLSKYEQLRYITDFLDGKITHYAYIGDWDTKIIPIEKAMCDVDRYKPRLLALYGDVKGRGVEWLLHRYSDSSDGMSQSGQWFPARSEEEANEIVRSHIAKQLARGDVTQRSGFSFFVKEAIRLGISVKDEHKQRVDQEDARIKQERITSAKNEFERVKANLQSLGIEVPA